jgi:type IV secretion system protein VirD4
MTAAQHADFRRRARNVFVFLPTAALLVGVASTQFVAWRLHYHPALGAPVFRHVYWPWRVLGWWQAPWEPQVDTTFQFVRFGTLLGVLLTLLFFLKSQGKRPRPAPNIHGSARFQTESEIRKGSLFPRGRSGIIVGGWTDRKGAIHYMTDAGEGHVLCLGPSRIGKTAAVLLPTALSWPESLVIYDPKGEVYKKTAGWRREEADNMVMRLAPAELQNTIRWNPFDSIELRSPYAFRDVANIIQQVADPQGAGFKEHWEPSAANLMIGIALFLIGQKRCNLTNILSAIDASSDSSTLLTEMSEHPMPQIAEVGRGLLSTASRERGSIVSTARRLLAVYRDPILAKSTACSDFGLEDLQYAGKPVTLYVETSSEDELRLRPLVRLLLNLILTKLSGIEGRSRNKLLLGIDEMPSLRKMEPLELFLTKGAGSDIRALLLAQDYQDIVAEYGEHERITSNCNVLTAHAPNNLMTAEWLSRKSGQTTRIVEEITESQQRGQRSTNRAYRSVGGNLLTADEVSRLRLPRRDKDGRITGPGEVLIFEAGQHVIRGTQSLAFRDEEFRRRMAIPPPQTMRVR